MRDRERERAGRKSEIERKERGEEGYKGTERERGEERKGRVRNREGGGEDERG